LKKLVLSTLLFLAGCVSSPEYRIDSVSENELESAKKEIESASVKKSRAFGWRKVNRLKKVISRLESPSKKICYALAENTSPQGCNWEIDYIDDPRINASADLSKNSRGEYHNNSHNVISIGRGVLDYTHNEDELALLVAHEIAHHIANHIMEDLSGGNTLAEGLGILVGMAIISNADITLDNVDTAINIVSTTKDIGSELSRYKFSRKQEAEADLIAIQMLDDAGYSIEKSKNFFLTLFAFGENNEISADFFDTHPSGPSRVAAMNKAMNEKNRSKIIQKITNWCSKQSIYNQWKYC
jgi:predicted Zn-dependent protease